MITKFLLMPFSHCDLGYTDYACESGSGIEYLRQVARPVRPVRGCMAWTAVSRDLEQGWTVKGSSMRPQQSSGEAS